MLWYEQEMGQQVARSEEVRMSKCEDFTALASLVAVTFSSLTQFINMSSFATRFARRRCRGTAGCRRTGATSRA